MPSIRRLPEHLVSKIAAGEVIERPFSVVKELVENSIDARAKNIQITIEEGGRKGITVVDDGTGMGREDALLALERHATSKLASDEDLYRIQTLGFRGEALPSIAAVSFMTMETKEVARESGVKIEIEGGKVLKNGSSALHQGTRISVNNLFFNTPARLKFLKSKETEFSHIAAWIEAVALSRPEIGFILRHGPKVELQTVATGELRLRIGDILGGDVAEFLRPVAAARSMMDLKGYVSDQRASSTSAKSLFFFVNGRIVRDRTLQHAVLSAYENLLMKHRTPWAVLHLTVPPDFVDVNVHPAKSEVKFANGSLVHEFVKNTVRGVLSESAAREFVPGPCGTPRTLSPGPDGPVQTGEKNGEPWMRIRPTEDYGQLAASDRSSGPSTNPLAADYRVIGQVHGTYLICENPEKLILIDQHAAHERIGFEKLKRQLDAGGIQRQQLLIPENFDLRPSQAEILKMYLDDLAKVGLEIESFGGNNFILRSIPVLLEGEDFVSLIEDLIEGLQSFERLTPFDERVHEVLETMACHNQVRAGQRLSNQEIEALIHEMGETRFSGQCPHGRPSVLEVSFSEIEKWFKRKL